MKLSPFWLGVACLAASAWSMPAQATEWAITTTSSSTQRSHCIVGNQESCWVTYTNTRISYSGYFDSQQAAGAACSSVLDGSGCGYASGEPGPPLMSGGWRTTCPGGVNQYGLCVSTLHRYAIAYFPTVVVEQDVERPQDCRSSARQFGNPIDGLTGEKRETVMLQRWSEHAPPLELHYRSGPFARQVGSSTLTGNNIPGLPGAGGAIGAGIPDGARPSPFGPLWTHSLDTQVQQQGRNAQISRIAGSGALSLRLQPDGSNWLPSAGLSDQLQFLGGAGGAYWLHRDPRQLRSRWFSHTGMLIHQSQADGTGRQWLSYSDSSTPRTVAAGPDRLLAVRDAFGRQLRVGWLRDAAGLATDLIGELSDDAGNRTRFEYDAQARLTAVRWPDGSAQRFTYDPQLPWALAMRIDETGVAVGNWRWDTSTGLVTSTAGADDVNRHQLSFGKPPQVVVSETLEGAILRRRYSWQPGVGAAVTMPNGTLVTLTGVGVQGEVQLAQRSQPAGAGCAASTSSVQHDAFGNAVVRDDFAGGRSCHAYDTTRQLELVRVEGLDRTTDCAAVLADGAALPVGARKTTTRWHPVWPLAEATAMPGRIVFRAYNERPDPLAASGATACLQGPVGADIPSDSSPAALCRQVQIATSDADGRLGFQANADPGAPSREERWTYNRQGQLLRHDGPRTDVADITTYDYHTITGADVTLGDLRSVTNAAGHVTRFHRYDRIGRLLEHQDANGVATLRVYDPRQRLVQSTQAGQSIGFNHAPNGLLSQATLPDGSRLTFGYDRAQRLVRISDGSSNRIDYTLDNEGHRIREERRDAQGLLTRRLTRAFDALGRVQEQVGRP